MLILSARDVGPLLNVREMIDAVDGAFAQHGQGATLAGVRVHVPAPQGGFHVAVGGLVGEVAVFSAKVNARLADARTGVVGVRGTILLVDASTGEQIALLDSPAITIWRTAAAAAVAARHLSRGVPARLLTVGAGRIAEASVEAIASTVPLEAIRIWSRTHSRAVASAERLGAKGVNCAAIRDLRRATRASDTIVTATSAREPLLHCEDVRPGSLVLAFGADAPDKQELDAKLIAAATVIVDSLEQCRVAGELRNALVAGLVAEEVVYGELGKIVAGLRPVPDRTSGVVVFDATGMAIQDAAAALVITRKARQRGVGREVSLD